MLEKQMNISISYASMPSITIKKTMSNQSPRKGLML